MLGATKTRRHFERQLLDQPLWPMEPELLHLHERLAVEKMQELARMDWIAEVRRAIGSRLESGTTTLDLVAAQLGLAVRRLRTQLAPVFSKCGPIAAVAWPNGCWRKRQNALSGLCI